MKNLGIILIVILVLSGCTGKMDEDQLVYNGYVEELKELKILRIVKNC